MTYYVLKELKEMPDLTDITGKVDIVDSFEGKAVEKLLKSGQYRIAPFGYSHGGGFILRGFSIVRNGQ